MKMNTKEHHTVYRAIIMCSSGGKGGPQQIFFFWQFFSACEKITQFLRYCNIKVVKFKLDYLGFYCKQSFLIGQSEKSEIVIEIEY